MDDATRPPKASVTGDVILHILVGIVLAVTIILAFTQDGVDQTTTGMFVVLLGFLLLQRQGKLATVRFNRKGFEAIMAEAREATQGAEKATKEVKEFMKVSSVAVLGLIKRNMVVGGYSYDDQEQIKQEILTNLSQTGITPEEIADIEKESKWHECVAAEYVHCIMRAMNLLMDDGGRRSTEAQELRKRPLSNLATPDELEEFLSRHSMLTPEARELIEDYRHYLDRHEQRRPEMWKKRRDWGELTRPTN